jgi:hypothetical protein
LTLLIASIRKSKNKKLSNEFIRCEEEEQETPFHKILSARVEKKTFRVFGLKDIWSNDIWPTHGLVGAAMAL